MGWLGREEQPRPGGVPLKGEDAKEAILSSGTPYDLHTPIDEGGDSGGSIARDVGPAGADAGAAPRQPGDGDRVPRGA